MYCTRKHAFSTTGAIIIQIVLVIKIKIILKIEIKIKIIIKIKIFIKVIKRVIKEELN